MAASRIYDIRDNFAALCELYDSLDQKVELIAVLFGPYDQSWVVSY